MIWLAHVLSNSVSILSRLLLPTVLTPEEARSIIGNMSGTPQLVVKLIYGGEKDKGPRLKGVLPKSFTFGWKC